MRSIIEYFALRPAVANVLMFGLIFSSIVTWNQIGKEEMPEFEMNWVRINIRYPGASAQDVELFITKPVEEKLKGVSGLEEVSSTSAYGSSSFRVVFLPTITNLSEKIQEVKDAVDSVELPRETEEPLYDQFRSDEKAIIDVGMYLQGKEILTVPDRIKLQEYALAFKNRVLSLPEISGIESSGYLRPELQIKVDPNQLKRYEISMDQVRDQIVQQNIRQPVGSMTDKGESEVTIISELDDIEPLEKVIVVSGFQGQRIRLDSIARIEHGFERTNSVVKVQGHEGVIFNIQKSSNVDILTAKEALVKFIRDFEKSNPELPVKFILMDDESYDVANRISLIATNGLLGFTLIVLVLFLFLDLKSGVWVAMGIPFSLAFTLIVALMQGYTVNNMTLAAVIIVLGIVVDDAIIIAENITRRLSEKKADPVTGATLEMVSPVMGSVLTTCAAFVPLYFFTGRFGLFVKVIPLIIFSMLAASLIESFFILPTHMARPLPGESFFKRKGFFARFGEGRDRIISALERGYAKLLKVTLRWRFVVLILFAALLGGAGYLFQNHMNYVMFPREESRNFSVRVIGEPNDTRYDMARKVGELERIFLNDPSGVVTSVRSTVGQSRRGGEVRENEASIRVEILPPSERKISLNQLMSGLEKKTSDLKGFEEIRYLKSRFGSDSGSPIVIEIQENNDKRRTLVAERLKAELEKLPSLTHVEIERPVVRKEFRLDIHRDEVSRLGINFEQLSSTLRAYIEGDILYTLNSGEEEVDVRFTSLDEHKDDIDQLVSLAVANRNNYLIPIRGLVDVKEGVKPANIQRTDYKRTVTVYADLRPNTNQTPLMIAEQLERDVFPKVVEGMPTTNLRFRGEIEDTRESQGDFLLSIIMVLLIIYVILVFIFNSIWTPFLIGAIVPFGAVAVILAFWAHGILHYGFFAVIGVLGMIGVIINDSIVLVDKLESYMDEALKEGAAYLEAIAEISSTRLRAVIVTTMTTVAGLFPTAYGVGGYDSMLAEMMLSMGWGLLLGMFITLLLVPCLYSLFFQVKLWKRRI